LAEAGAEILDIPISTESRSAQSQGEDQDLISSRLRKKVPKKPSSQVPKGLIPLAKLKESDVGVNFPVAKVKGGRILIGAVDSVIPGDAGAGPSRSFLCPRGLSQRTGVPMRWNLKFDDDSEERGVTWNRLK
jgi:hypothetical protein